MRTAIVSAGPSAAQTWPLRPCEYDSVIAINSTACMPWLGPYDWWAAFDRVTMDRCRHAARPRHGILCSDKSKTAVITERFPLDMDTAGLRWIDWRIIPNRRQITTSYSVTYALLFASWDDSRLIDVYGCDWDGEADVSGDVRAGRNPERWRKDRREFTTAQTALAALGITVHRITPEGTDP